MSQPDGLGVNENATQGCPAENHCLYCGYNRRGLRADGLCPECGKPDLRAVQRAECLSLARKPLKLVWRFVTLRRLPLGWWEVFDDPKTAPFPARRIWAMLAFSLLLLCTLMVLGNMVRVEGKTRTFFYDVNDPDRESVAEIRSDQLGIAMTPFLFRSRGWSAPPPRPAQSHWAITTEYTRRINVDFELSWLRDIAGLSLILGVYIILSWIFLRYAWLNCIIARRDKIDEEARTAAKRTADCLVMIIPAQIIWTFAVTIVVSCIILASPFGLTTLAAWGPAEIPIFVVLFFFAPVAWWRALASDKGHRVIPYRGWAFILLLVAILVPFVLMVVIAYLDIRFLV